MVPGVHAVHAVDAAGVHPLLLAIGSERYVPYAERRRPQELLTCANAMLGQGQLSLAKYLLIVARRTIPASTSTTSPAFFRHLLERVDWRTDLHFQTCTTIDTLDYSGTGLNEGSKVVIAAAGPRGASWPHAAAGGAAPAGRLRRAARVPAGRAGGAGAGHLSTRHEPPPTCAVLRRARGAATRSTGFRWSCWWTTASSRRATLNNLLWVTFTRSNPAADVHGVGAFTRQKHWGCTGPLVIDARIKPHHAPPLEEDPAVTRRVDALAAPGGPLHGII